MGLEYKIETDDSIRAGIRDYVKLLPEFLREDDGQLQLTNDGATVALTVVPDDEHANVYVIQHVACRETDALLALVIRRVLSVNDHVIISEC
jgi:hypothetical protein